MSKDTLVEELDFMKSILQKMDLKVALTHCDFHFYNIVYDKATGKLHFKISQKRLNLNHLIIMLSETYICVSKLTIVGLDNGLSPGWRQTVIRTNAGIWLIKPLGTNFSEIVIEIPTCPFKKMRLKVSSAKWQPFCLGHSSASRLRTSCWQYCNTYLYLTYLSRHPNGFITVPAYAVAIEMTTKFSTVIYLAFNDFEFVFALYFEYSKWPTKSHVRPWNFES